MVILSTSPPTGTRGDVIGRERTESQVNDGHSPSITIIAGHGRSNPGEVVGGTLEQRAGRQDAPIRRQREKILTKEGAQDPDDAQYQQQPNSDGS